jgi:hypothetical protein
MLDLESLMSGAPVPAVGADAVRRAWEFMTFVKDASPPTGAAAGGIGLDINVIARECGEGVDPIAVWARAALLQTLLQSGVLDDWRAGNRPYDVVFEAIAKFPLPGGLQRFRPEEFAETLRKRE